MFRHVKYFFLIFILFSSCKEDVFIDAEHPSNEFGVEGKSFSYYQLNSTTWPVVTLNILPNSVSQNNYVEYYTKLLDADNVLDSFEINYAKRDLNYFISSCTQLQTNAILTLPISVTFLLPSGYKPYKIKISGTTDHFSQLNDPANWTLITNFTWDNTAKTISFETDDLNACYVIAKHL